MLKSIDFWLATFSACFAICLNFSFSTLIGEFTKPYQPDADIELMGILFNCGGMFGCIIASIYISLPLKNNINNLYTVQK